MPISSALSTIATALRPARAIRRAPRSSTWRSRSASREGLEGLTIGTLADHMQMSKSGVFAHFGSREELQLAVLNEYVRASSTKCCAPR